MEHTKKQMSSCPKVVCYIRLFKPTQKFFFSLDFLGNFSCIMACYFSCVLFFPILLYFLSPTTSLSISKCILRIYLAKIVFWFLCITAGVYSLALQCFQLWKLYFILANHVWQVTKYSWSPFYFVAYVVFALAQQQLSTVMSSSSLLWLLSYQDWLSSALCTTTASKHSIPVFCIYCIGFV